MKVYNAGSYYASFGLSGSVFNRLSEAEKELRCKAIYFLEPYHYLQRQSFIDNVRRDGVKLFLDSGAFSAFTQGATLHVDEYCEYIRRNRDIIDTTEDGDVLASVLDSIGDPMKTWQNQQHMEYLGIKPLPCFHYGEDERYLEHYIANYNYITLGGMVPITTPQLRLWLDRIWDRYLTDGSGRPRVKVHGFGLTTISLLTRYPWYSVDSSGWNVIARTGGFLLLPEGKVYRISSDSPARKVEGLHVDSMPEPQKNYLEERLRALGMDPDRMRTQWPPRWAYNSWAFYELGNIHQKSHDYQFTSRQELIF